MEEIWQKCNIYLESVNKFAQTAINPGIKI